MTIKIIIKSTNEILLKGKEEITVTNDGKIK